MLPIRESVDEVIKKSSLSIGQNGSFGDWALIPIIDNHKFGRVGVPLNSNNRQINKFRRRCCWSGLITIVIDGSYRNRQHD